VEHWTAEAGRSGPDTEEMRTQFPAVSGESRSTVSRKFIEASAAQLQALAKRCIDEVPLLAIYIDGIVMERHHIVTVIGVDEAGDKHLLRLSRGATENAQVVKDLACPPSLRRCLASTN